MITTNNNWKVTEICLVKCEGERGRKILKFVRVRYMYTGTENALLQHSNASFAGVTPVNQSGWWKVTPPSQGQCKVRAARVTVWISHSKIHTYTRGSLSYS